MGKSSNNRASITSVGQRVKVKKRARKGYAEIISGLSGDLDTLMDHWRDAKGMMLKAFLGKKPITEREESAFLEMKTKLSRLSRNIDARLPGYLEVGVDDIDKIIKAGINLKVLNQLPTITKKNLYGKWHVAHVQMHRTVGALQFFETGYRPPKRKTRQNPITAAAEQLSGLFGHRVGDKGQESPVKTIAIIVGGLLAVGILIAVAISL